MRHDESQSSLTINVWRVTAILRTSICFSVVENVRFRWIDDRLGLECRETTAWGAMAALDCVACGVRAVQRGPGGEKV